MLRPLGLIAGISLVANLVVFAVALMSVAIVVVGGIALLVTRRWAPRAWQVLAWVGLVIGIVTIPVFADADAGTRVALGAMHVIVGGVWFWFVSRLAK